MLRAPTTARSLLLQRVPEPKPGKNRMHVDIIAYDIEGEGEGARGAGRRTPRRCSGRPVRHDLDHHGRPRGQRVLRLSGMSMPRYDEGARRRSRRHRSSSSTASPNTAGRYAYVQQKLAEAGYVSHASTSAATAKPRASRARSARRDEFVDDRRGWGSARAGHAGPPVHRRALHGDASRRSRFSASAIRTASAGRAVRVSDLARAGDARRAGRPRSARHPAGDGFTRPRDRPRLRRGPARLQRERSTGVHRRRHARLATRLRGGGAGERAGPARPRRRRPDRRRVGLAGSARSCSRAQTRG